VLERKDNEVLFRLTTFPEGGRPSSSWVSRRIIDKPGRQATAERVEIAFPSGNEDPLDLRGVTAGVGVIMTWIQEFEPAEGAWSTEAGVFHEWEYAHSDARH
jgi:aromatase